MHESTPFSYQAKTVVKQAPETRHQSDSERAAGNPFAGEPERTQQRRTACANKTGPSINTRGFEGVRRQCRRHARIISALISQMFLRRGAIATGSAWRASCVFSPFHDPAATARNPLHPPRTAKQTRRWRIGGDGDDFASACIVDRRPLRWLTRPFHGDLLADGRGRWNRLPILPKTFQMQDNRFAE